MVRSATVLLVVGMTLAAVASISSAQVFRWTDERGNPHYVEGLDNVPERHRAQAVPLGYRNSPAEPSPTSTKPPTSGVTTIRFTPGERIMVDVRINGSTPARLMLDTGADRTLINPRVLAAAGVSPRRAIAAQIRGVTGQERAQAMIIDSLEVGEARAGKMVVYAYDMDFPGSDGLLGRDFLNQFAVSIDPARGVVSITPK